MIVVNNREELKELINKRIEEQGPNCDLNDIDVSHIPDMSYLFYNSTFNGSISKWNVHRVVDMVCMFEKSKFNRNISKWNVSGVEDMSWRFSKSQFKGDISK